MTPAIRLSPQHVQEMVDRVRAAAPLEACGLIAGRDDRVLEIIPIANIANDPQHRFEMEPNALLKAFQHIEQADMDCIGVYHSHPASAPLPSQDDIHAAQRDMPNAVQVIISLQGTKPRLQAWRITPEGVDPVELLIGQMQTQSEDAMTRTQQLAVLLITIISLVLLWGIALTLLPPAPSLTTP